jgi:hypothetical protein
MRSLRLTLLALGTLVLACSGEGIQAEDTPSPSDPDGGAASSIGGSDGDPAAPDGGAAPGGTGGGSTTGGFGGGYGGDIGGYPYTGGAAGAGAISSTGGAETGGWTSTGGAATGGAIWTGGYGGDIGGYPATGGTSAGGSSTGGTGEWINYFDPAPPQPTEFSCCVIWAYCVHHQLDYRCTESTLLVTNSNRDDACDIWLQQVQEPLGSDSIPYCL